MNQEKLSKIFTKNIDSYPHFHEYVLKNSTSEKWGAGKMPPFTLEPYDVELLGCNRGKLLKKLSSPAKNRFKYLFDQNNRMLNVVGYSAILNDGEWLRYEEIFEYHDEGIFKFDFSGVTDDPTDAQLQKVTYLTISTEGPKTSHIFGKNDSYVEIDYQYNKGKIGSIKMRLWQESYFERFFEIKHEDKEIFINEIANGKTHPVYPRK